jgi:hypothetical protein
MVNEDGTDCVPDGPEQALEKAKACWPNDPLAVLKAFLFDVQPGDLVWIHQNRKYWLCKVGIDVLYGRDIAPDYRDMDLGFARRATWVEVEAEMISGAVLRGCIAPITMQPIRMSPEEQVAYSQLHVEKSKNAAWRPRCTEEQLLAWLHPARRAVMLRILTPDDHEDLIAYYLQANDWLLRKSSCFRSHPEFEFQMHRKSDGLTGFVQVKSGDVRLDARDYAGKCSEGHVFLHASAGVLNREAASQVTVLEMDDILDWVKAHLWALNPSLRTRMALLEGISE